MVSNYKLTVVEWNCMTFGIRKLHFPSKSSQKLSQFRRRGLVCWIKNIWFSREEDRMYKQKVYGTMVCDGKRWLASLRNCETWVGLWWIDTLFELLFRCEKQVNEGGWCSSGAVVTFFFGFLNLGVCIFWGRLIGICIFFYGIDSNERQSKRWTF